MSSADRWRNPSGTYNGVKMFSDLTGLSEAEIKWTWERTKTLINKEGKSKKEARKIIKEESRSRPWEPGL